MKKKVVSVLLCVAMTATMLLGCSAGSEKSDSKKCQNQSVLSFNRRHQRTDRDRD